MEPKDMTGAAILLEALIHQGIDTIFGYPGGQIMPVYNELYSRRDRLRHILVRHEQGAIHAAQGYARVKNTPGCVMVTSGPGATNVVTGIADAMVDSTPLVIIAGQVNNKALGTDAFQETDFIGLTTPIAKWTFQIRSAKDIAPAVAKAFYIAGSGRPGPVVLDFTKDAQVETIPYEPCKCSYIRSYVPVPRPSEESLVKAAAMINAAERPFVVFGHGVMLSGAEAELEAFLEKGDIPAGSTLLGLSSLSSDNPRFKGMLGMHGNIAPNVMTQKCDLLIAVGMRFDDRVTGTVSTYATQAKKIHIDIDASEIGKIIPVDLGILGDAKEVLRRLTELIRPAQHGEWQMMGIIESAQEKHKVIEPETMPESGLLKPGEVVAAVAGICEGRAIVVTDVGQNQMFAARYSRFAMNRSMISSGGLGTMGFGLPAAIGAKIAAPGRPVCLFVGDGGFQMTMQELGTILQEKTGVKIVLLNNSWLGNVRQWQELFFNKQYSATYLVNPDFEKIAQAYGISCRTVKERADLKDAVREMLSDDRPFILNALVEEEDNVFPMIPPGKSVNEIMLNETDWLE